MGPAGLFSLDPKPSTAGAGTAWVPANEEWLCIRRMVFRSFQTTESVPEGSEVTCLSLVLDRRRLRASAISRRLDVPKRAPDGGSSGIGKKNAATDPIPFSGEDPVVVVKLKVYDPGLNVWPSLMLPRPVTVHEVDGNGMLFNVAKSMKVTDVVKFMVKLPDPLPMPVTALGRTRLNPTMSTSGASESPAAVPDPDPTAHDESMKPVLGPAVLKVPPKVPTEPVTEKLLTVPDTSVPAP